MPRNTRRTRIGAGRGSGASMRPRRDAAEYGVITRLQDLKDYASMRPRRDAAEYTGHVVQQHLAIAASMRPRRDAAEYV